jgi:DNA-binding transcriptional regulator YhcF (GntR family)
MKTRAADRAYEYIRKRIVNGDYRPGQHLMVKTVADELAVSPTPVRDALRQLEADGLVTIRPRLGAQVNAMGLKEFRELCELRLVLETHTAGLAAQHRTEAELRELELAFREMRTLLMTSADGRTWSSPAVAFPEYQLPEINRDGIHIAKGMFAVMHQRMGFHVAPNGRLLTLGFYGYCENLRHSPNSGNGLGRVVREVRADGTLGPIYFIRFNQHAGFDASNTAYPFYRDSKDAGFLAACEALLADKLMTLQWWEEDRGEDGFYAINPGKVADAAAFSAKVVTHAGAGKAEPGSRQDVDPDCEEHHALDDRLKDLGPAHERRPLYARAQSIGDDEQPVSHGRVHGRRRPRVRHSALPAAGGGAAAFSGQLQDARHSVFSRR